MPHQQKQRTEILGEQNGFPKVKAAKNGNSISFYCQYCKRKHIHGIPFPESLKVRGSEHRVSHCSNSDSPLFNGYYLVWGEIDE